VTGKPFGQVPFQAHVELLRLFLAHREDIVESIEAVLNAQRKPIRYLQDHSLLSRHFEDCFFAHIAVTASQERLMCTDLVIPENVADQASVPPSIEKAGPVIATASSEAKERGEEG
jgi:hypothetical protein